MKFPSGSLSVTPWWVKLRALVSSIVLLSDDILRTSHSYNKLCKRYNNSEIVLVLAGYAPLFHCHLSLWVLSLACPQPSSPPLAVKWDLLYWLQLYELVSSTSHDEAVHADPVDLVAHLIPRVYTYINAIFSHKNIYLPWLHRLVSLDRKCCHEVWWLPCVEMDFLQSLPAAMVMCNGILRMKR